MSAKDTTPHLYLVDGSGYIFRAYHALPPMNRRDGTPTNAAFGFTNMLYKLLADVNAGAAPTHLAVIFDAAKRSFRNDIYEDYKANRPEAPEDLVPQFPMIREAVEAFNVPSVELEGYEADDIIATYARQAREKGWQVTIVSSDKDLMQLVEDGTVTLLDTMKDKRIGPEEVKERFGVGPEKVIEVQALCGDSSDNVPGVPGIGPKTAAQLIDEYGDVETLLEHLDEIKQPKRRESLEAHAEDARMSKKLVTLDPKVPLDDRPLDSLAVRELEPKALLAFVDANDFRSLHARLVQKYGDVVDSEAESREAEEVAVGETDYVTIDGINALEDWIAAIREAGRVAMDTETTALNSARAELVGISLSLEAGKAAYIPLRHRAGEGLDFDDEANAKQIPLKDALAALKPVFEDPSILKIAHNAKYDYAMLMGEGVAMAPIEDTMLISYVLEGGKHGHGLDELAELHLGITPISYKEVAGSGKSQVTFDRVAIDKATDYAAEDADLCGRLYRLLKPELPKAGLLTVYETIERPLIPVIAAMEAAGVKVDRSELNRLSKSFAEGMAALEAEIHELAGERFNINSPKQLGEILFDKMGLKSERRSAKTRAASTSAEVLERLAAEGHDLPKKVLAWRRLQKLKSTYADALAEAINPKTGRVHTSYSMAVTSTGRLSSTEPNLQNIPVRTEEGRKIRRAFVAEEGNRLIAADYSQIELRIFAHMAGIGTLKEAFEQGLDIHAMTASQVFGVEMEGMDPLTRRKAKAINFGIIYGISPFGLARQLDIDRHEAKAYIDAYFERFPGIQGYMDDTKEIARERGWVETLFGRRVHVPDIKAKNPNQRAFAERAAINAPIQGTAADIIKRAMLRMPKALEEAGLEDVRMLLQVHDELIFEAPEALVEKAAPVIRGVMAHACDPVVSLDVPLVVDIGVAETWDDAH